MKRLYRKRKENSCCTRCGEQDARTLSGRTFCKRCYEGTFECRANAYKDRYQWYKRHNMCPKCGKQDAYTLGGRTYCYECAEQKRIKQGFKNYIDPLSFTAHKKDQKNYSKIPREQFSELGLCSVCGKPVKPGYKVCENHYANLVEMRGKVKSNPIKDRINREYRLQRAIKNAKSMQWWKEHSEP